MALPKRLLTSRADLETASRSRAAGVYYGEHRLLCRLLGDYLAFVDTRDLMLGPRLVLDGFWEAWVTLAIARHLKTGMWCVDVGANYGYYTLLMAAGCGSGGHFATSSLEPWAYARSSRTIAAPAITLDRLCAEWPRLDLVKIDAEGAENLVWEGMQKSLNRFPDVAVVVELHLQRDVTQTARFLQRVEHAGGPLRRINYQGEIVPIDATTIMSQPHEHWTLWLQR